MKKIIILLSMFLSTYVYSQDYKFNIPLENQKHEVIKFNSESGTTYNWDRCYGQTTQTLSEDGVSCEKVINSRSGFTGSVDVCVTATKDYLSDPYCFAMCGSESVSWGNCTASVSLSEHLEIKNITNTDNRYVGTAEMLCTDGVWSIKSSNCEDNLASCGTDHNTVNNTPSKLCEIGNSSSVTANANTMNWNCATSANTVACLSYKVALCDNTTFNGCSVGTSSGYTSVVTDTTATWTCTNSTSSESCSKVKLAAVNGSCGSVNGTTVASKPTVNLCITGTPSTVLTNTTTHTWSCQGSSSSDTQLAGSSNNCSANREPICSSGLTWNGSVCTGTQTQSATATCPSGGSPSGDYCYSYYTYSAYGCPYGTSYSGGMCSGYTYEYTSSEKVCPSGYTYDGDACARDCYRGSTTCSYTYPTYICPSGWTNGYICSRQVYTTTPLEYQGCNSGDGESGDGTCYSSEQVGSVSYTCPSSWNKSGTTCTRTINQSPVGYK